jgi:hypothetical protein
MRRDSLRSQCRTDRDVQLSLSRLSAREWRALHRSCLYAGKGGQDHKRFALLPVTTQRRAKPWVVTSAGFAPNAVRGSSAASPTQDTASPLRVWMTRVCSNRSSKFGPPKRSLGTRWIRNCRSSSGIQLENSIDGWTFRMKMLDSNPVSDLPLVRAKF